MGFVIQKLLNQHLTDLNPIAAGWSTEDHGSNGSQTSPRIFFLLHYVSHGSGMLTLDDQAYPVHAGQCFLVPPHCTSFRFCSDEPTNQKWVGFTGSMSHDFEQLPAVFDLPEGLMPHLRDLDEIDSNTAYDLAADLLLLRSRMLPAGEQHADYVEYVTDYIHTYYMHPGLTVESIASLMNLDRSYLSRLFKKKTNQTLQNYILDVRLLAAKRCLMENRSVKETALLCGFRDPYAFSKLFLQKTDFSPSEWKKIALDNLTTKQNAFIEARKNKKKNTP